MANKVITQRLALAAPTLAACLCGCSGEFATLAAEKETLRAEIATLQAAPKANDVHRHWQFVHDWFNKNQHMNVAAAKKRPPDIAESYGGTWRGGVVTGPALQVLAAAQRLQPEVPIFFDSFSASKGRATLSFFVLGGKANGKRLSQT